MTSIETKGLPVLLTIRSEQHFEGMEPDGVELMTEGTLTPTGEGGLLLSYQETALTGLEGTTTTFEVRAIDIQTSRLRHSLTEQGGLMDLRYSISVEHSATGRNAFKIRVRRKHEARENGQS